MKVIVLAHLAFLILSSLAVNAVPSPSYDNQAVFLQNPLNDWLDTAKHEILSGKKNLEKWFYKGRQYIKQNNLLCAGISVLSQMFHLTYINAPDEFITHPNFTAYDLRVTEPSLCDTSVKQYSGYLDIANDKHLFFWLAPLP